MKIFVKIGSMILFSSLLFGTNLPNIWTIGFGQGWLEYNISNEKEQIEFKEWLKDLKPFNNSSYSPYIGA